MGFAESLATGDVAVRELLGSTVTYSPSSGSPVDVSGVFDAAYIRVDAGQAGISSSGPAVFLTISDLPSDPTTAVATVTVAGTTYSVREAQPDGMGGVLLLLHTT